MEAHVHSHSTPLSVPLTPTLYFPVSSLRVRPTCWSTPKLKSRSTWSRFTMRLWLEISPRRVLEWVESAPNDEVRMTNPPQLLEDPQQCEQMAKRLKRTPPNSHRRSPDKPLNSLHYPEFIIAHSGVRLLRINTGPIASVVEESMNVEVSRMPPYIHLPAVESWRGQSTAEEHRHFGEECSLT